MKKFVIDVSVFAKIFIEEKDSNIALEFLTNACNKNYRLLVPPLFKVEFLSIVRHGNLDFAIAYDIIQDYFDLIIKEIDLSKEIMEQALLISQTGNSKSGYPSVYDAIYHAIAIINNCDFITSDNKHYEKTKKFGHIKLLEDL